METWGLLCGIATILILLYYYFTSNFEFWKIRNIKGPKPVVLFGTLQDVILGKTYFGDYATKIYNQYKSEPFVGIFSRRTPILILNDPDLIKDVLIKDFSIFASRGIEVTDKSEPFSTHLFRIEPARWRPLRVKLSPVFTSGKLKEMFYILRNCSEDFGRFFDKLVKKTNVLECRELTAKFTTDVIGSCVFGLNMNSLTEEESEFRRMGKRIFEPTLWKSIKMRIRESVPRVYNFLWPIFLDREQKKFFINILKDTMEYRKKNNIVRHDFVDLLSEIKDNPQKVGDIEMTDTLITAQAFVFFAAGFETSSTNMSNALYELALNHSIQDKLRQEIREEYNKNNGLLNYESLKNMKYMDQVFRETLRKYPPVSVLTRESCKSYTFKGTNMTIPSNIKIWIPVYAIQRDPDIYPNPELFDPSRFVDEQIKFRHPMHYLPFGDGPRNCIGARFAVFQTKIGLAKILQHHKVDVCEKTMKSYVNHPEAFLLTPKEGIHLKFTKISG